MPMTHAKVMRMIWIDAQIIGGRSLNRGDICAAFGVSMVQASNDIADYARMNPGRISYSTKSRTYRAVPGTAPAFNTSIRISVLPAVRAARAQMEVL